MKEFEQRLEYGRLLLDVSYIPYNFKGEVNFSKIVEVRGKVEDPELAGLTAMRMLRKVLSGI